MNTSTSFPKSPHVHVQMPQNLEAVLAFDKYLHQNGWKRKKYNYYNRITKQYASAQELYPMFRNINQS